MQSRPGLGKPQLQDHPSGRYPLVMNKKLQPATREWTFLDTLEPALSLAAAGAEPTVAQEIRDYLSLFGEPEHTLYTPADLLVRLSKSMPEHRWSLDGAGTEDAVGAETALAAMLQRVAGAYDLTGDTRLRFTAETLSEHGRSAVALRIAPDGPARLPDPLPLFPHFSVSLETLSGCWALATNGGKIERTGNDLFVRFGGMRMPPEAKPEAATLATLLGPAPTAADCAKALAWIDGPAEAAPVDVRTVWESVADTYGPFWHDAGITVHADFDAGLPPIALRRTRLRCFFVQTLAWVRRCSGDTGAVVRLEVVPAADTRRMLISITVTSPEGRLAEDFHGTSLKRAVKDLQGNMDLLVEPEEALIALSLPDPIGSTLDTWIPGWETFTARGQQFLRLLKSGGQTPPEDFVLGGILEEELERRMLPRLKLPVAQHLAKEFHGNNQGLAGSHPERLKKAIAQIARDGVKKEICQPAYAGEIFWAFRHDERERFAAGVEGFDEGTLRSFCEALLAQPPRHVEALGFVARMPVGS